MKSVRQIFSRGGGGATATISGLILAGGLIIGLMMSCKEENSSKPTAPNIPVFPEGQTSENSNEMSFYSEKGNGDIGARADKNGEFIVSVPAGEYLLTYGASNGGTYYVAFRATTAAKLHIGLRDNMQVLSIAVQKGKIINESQKQWVSNAVTLFAWPDGPAWSDVFQGNGSTELVKAYVSQTGEYWQTTGEIPAPPYTIPPLPQSNEQATVSMNTDVNNPLIAALRTESGWIMNVFGTKNSVGSATAINYACMQMPNQQVVTVMFDSQKRPTQFSYGAGSVIAVDWNAKTIGAISGTLSCPQAITPPDAKMSKTMSLANFASAAECESFKNQVSQSMNSLYGFAAITAGLAAVTFAAPEFSVPLAVTAAISTGMAAALGLFNDNLHCDEITTTTTTTTTTTSTTTTIVATPHNCPLYQTAGGDAPEAHSVEMFAKSGTFQFAYDTYSIKDQIVVTYEGRTLLDTGCVGTSNSQALSFNGNSTSILVTVSPDCAGETGTAWNFTVDCPK